MDKLYTRRRNKSKKTAAYLAIFLGWLGVHKFYLRDIGAGIVYLFCSLCGFVIIPLLIGIFEGVSILLMFEQRFDKKYN